MAVVSSGLYGTVSGSSVADCYATGTFTIPLMKKIGYRPEIAGAIEACASCGGPLMPPIMGAGAFIMAELTGIPYGQIIIAAALPAILYYAGIMATVHWEALKHGIGTMHADLPSMGSLAAPLAALRCRSSPSSTSCTPATRRRRPRSTACSRRWSCPGSRATRR